jgi:hypothetical protein
MSRVTLAAVKRVALYTVLGTWFVASAVKQEPTRRSKLSERIDPHGVFLPDWRFFAPQPGTYDNHLLFRDELADGTVTEWKEVLVAGERTLRHAFWHPNRRGEKIVFDTMNEIIKITQEPALEKEDIQVSVAYLTLLNFVTHSQRHATGTKRTQFLVARSSGRDVDEEPVMLFLSNRHPIA